jgi:hypothetical protein
MASENEDIVDRVAVRLRSMRRRGSEIDRLPLWLCAQEPS